ncbi:RNA polymerase [Pedobacter ginsengisoli]|uniref:RNA polymerase n=1 Tax=Pedobacter ginsengisoli TaxID=363852 RepID=A0A2D1U0L4_9SPHI|nr:sigma-70 family RNA polymerase sigma factor [Pedobacter ginsengisoli]ATP55158.1 RNA polymerase [Pedobacter ginsengisoli]
MHEIDDHDILIDLIAGCDKAFSTVYHTYQNQAYTYLFRRTGSVTFAEELVQLSFIKLWKNATALNPTIALNIQLFRICRTVMIDEIRRLAVRKNTEMGYIDVVGEPAANNDALVKQLKDDIHSAISALPPARKKIFQLSRIEGYSHKEIAQMMSISTSTVEDHIGKALKLLRRKLKDSIYFFLF